LYYSRYADDITISGEFAPGFILNGISKIIQSEGFQINEDKTRVMNDGQRKIVTGIVVNKDLNAPRIYRRRIIQEVFFIKKYGLLSHLEFIGCNKSRYLHHLLGKINFSLHINSIDRKLIDAREFVKELMKQ